jgi:hypothetical protein
MPKREIPHVDLEEALPAFVPIYYEIRKKSGRGRADEFQEGEMSCLLDGTMAAAQGNRSNLL